MSRTTAGRHGARGVTWRHEGSCRHSNADARTPSQCLETAHALLARYAEQPGDDVLREEIADFRHIVAQAVINLPALGKDDPECEAVRKLIRDLMQSGAADHPVDPADLAAADDCRQQGWPGLLAAMLLVPAWQWPGAPRFDEVPTWLWLDYALYVFASPQGFTACGQAETHAAHHLRRLEEVVRLLDANRGSAAVRALVTIYQRTSNCIPLYFSLSSLRRHYELRGHLLMSATGTGATTPLAPLPRPGRRLRVGFINRHFGPQTETYTTLPTFEQLDPARFEVLLFAHEAADTPLERHARTRTAGFQVLPAALDDQVRVLREAALDVAVFGTNVTAVCHEVTLLACHRVAPLQVANNSSCTTTGLPEIDLYVSGTLTEAPGAEQNFTERLGLLPGPAHAFDYEADRQEPAGTWTRAALGLPEDAVVFVSAANYFKIIPEMREAWARLLAAVPGSRLLLHPFNPNWSSSYPVKRFCAEFDRVLEAHGVATDRLVVSSVRFPSRTDVKELIRTGDIYLDTFPFAGVNSLVDPLELGLPVVAWEGDTFRSRMGGALLRQLGLDELVATDETGYLALATRLATDADGRTALKARIVDAMESSPVFLDPLAASDAFGALLELAFDEQVAVGHAEFRRNRTPLRVPAPADAMERVSAGVTAFGADDTVTAADCAREVLGAAPTHTAARHLLGAVMLRNGNAARAVDYLLGAVQQGGNNAPVWHDLAVALAEAGRPAQALEAVRTSLHLDGQRLEGWQLLGELALKAGQSDLLAQALARIDAIAPDDPRAVELRQRAGLSLPAKTAGNNAARHILLYTDDPEHGGVAHYNHSLLLALARAGHRVSCAQTQSESALVAAQRAAGVRHHWIGYDTGREFARTLTDGTVAQRILQADRPDLVIFSDCCPLSNLAARETARQLGIPYIVVVGFVGYYLAKTFAAQLPLLAAQYAAARAVVAVSQENLALLRAHFGLAADRGQVIHYGRPEEFFQPRDEKVRARLRAGLGVPAEAVVCFTAARLTGVKRHDLQLEAITQLAAGRTASDLHFVWAGDGDQRAVLEKEIQRRGLARCVHLLGQRTDVREWYDAADIFVLPSQIEGMPLAIMEAMAKGLPVIATAVSGIPEELGDTGKLLPDPAADPRGVVGGLVGTISNWAAHPAVRSALGRRGRDRADQMFREERMLELTLGLIGQQLRVGSPTESPQGVDAASNSIAQPIVAPPAGFVSQLTQFFKGPKLLQVDWTDGATATIIHHDDGQTAGTAREVKAAGAGPRFPLPDGSVDTVFNLGSLARVEERALPGWLAELWRVTGRNLWFALEAGPGRDHQWWETKFFEAGFRKHPLMSLVVPYPASERDESRVMLVLEKIPAAALAKYPLSALKAERDLHMDMLREAGVRSEAHLARYQLAARHARDGGVILDAACGLGYGSAMLAQQFPHARVIGVDISEYAIDYARANFAGVLPNLEFHLADACNLSMIAEGTVDLVVSFETIEHVPDPGLFLRGAVQRMKAGATFIGSIPNLWLDETGKDPNPWHFHVFDLPKFYQLMAGFLHVSHVYRENAGGHLRNTASGPDLRAVQLPVTDQLEEAEWWIIAARKTPAALAATGKKPRIWLIDGEIRGRFYVQLQESFEAEWLIGSSIQPENLDLAIVSDEWWAPSSVEVQRLKRLGVPTLHVVDGVVDWKNTWENPRSLSAAAGLPLFQPVLSDKIACLGQAQARILGTWGNAAKCEIVGAPRFDRYYALKRRKRTAEMPARILIVTANTPYFNEQQHADILEGLKDLKEFFALAAQEGIPIEPVWRLTKGLDAELGLTPAATAARELADVLGTVDGVIGSSSTALLEAMLLGLPTALLDYSNCPHYLQPAWQITAARQIPLVVGELVNPPPPKMLEQETVLHDNLECASPATARLIQLVTVMIEEGRRARRCGEMPSFRPQMLSPGTPGQILPENRFNLAKLYPDHPVFRIDSIAELQAELNHWRKNHSESMWKSYALLTVQWRSKLEAATILSGLGQSEAAVDLMMQSLKVVESCNQPEVVMEAVLEVSTHLAPHDAGRTRRLLAMALNLARRLGRADAIQRATQMLEALSPLDSKMAS